MYYIPGLLSGGGLHEVAGGAGGGAGAEGGAVHARVGVAHAHRARRHAQDGAHQLGGVGGHQHPRPLQEPAGHPVTTTILNVCKQREDVATQLLLSAKQTCRS